MQSKLTLTSDQNEACNKFLGFLLSKETEFHLFGSAGCGKTFLTRHFITHVLKNEYENACKILGQKPKKYSVYLTATTNKAAEVLGESVFGEPGVPQDVTTVFKLFNVSVGQNFQTGDTFLREGKNTSPVEDALIFIDECSMLPQKMLDIIRRTTNKCKLVFVGDNNQLAPVNEKPMWDNTPELTTARLSTPVRNKDSQALIDLCSQLRETVTTEVFRDIQLDGKSIVHLNDEETLDWITSTDYTKNKVLCYTNKRAIQYIDLISSKLHPNEALLRLHGIYTNNSNFEYKRGKETTRFYPEETVQIVKLGEAQTFQTPAMGYSFAAIEGRVRSIKNPGKEAKVLLSVDPTELKNLIKETAKNRDWTDYFYLQNCVMDLRLPYACTVHKSQGNTYDEVLIDLDSFHQCQDPKVAARLLYVAVSRAKHRVLLYGGLPHRYGRLL